MAVVTVTRTSALFNDQDGDGYIDPGDTLITHIRLINPPGSPNITAANFQDNLNGVTLVPGTVTVTPIANDDNLGTITGNTPQTFNYSTILANDYDPDDNTPSFTVQIGSATHGAVTDNGDGTFNFTPDTGYVGGASFTYFVTNDGLQSISSGTVNITVQGLVWYVDSTAAPGGDGSYGHSFTDFSQLNGAGDKDGAGDTIYVHGTVNQGLTLEAQEKLYGDGNAFSVNGHTISVGGSTSTLSATSGNVVTLSTDNEVKGVTLNANGAGVVGMANTAVTSVTTGANTLLGTHLVFTGAGEAIKIDSGGNLNLTVDSLTSSGSSTNAVQLAGTASSGTGLITGTVNITTGTISGATSSAVLLGVGGGGTANSGGNVNLTYGGTIASGTGSAVEIEDRTGGSATFSGNITHNGAAAFGIRMDGNASSTATFSGQSISLTGTGAGIGASITNNTGSTINFTPAGGGNGLDITTNSGTGMTFTGGGTLNLTGAGNTVATTSGKLLDFQNGSVGASHVAFASLTQSGGTVTGTAVNFTNIDSNQVNIGSISVAAASGDGIRIDGGSSSAFTIGNTTVSSITNAANHGIELNGNVASVTFNGNVNVTTGSAAAGISLDNNSGSISFTGGTKNVTTTGGTGLNITANSAAIDFHNGGFVLNTGAGKGISAAGAGTLQIHGTGNTISTTTGQAIDISGVQSAGITLQSVNATGQVVSKNDISLVNMGSGGFTITGTGTTAGSGGTLNGATGTDGTDTQGSGIYINNTNNISLSYMNFAGTYQNYGIRGITVNNFLLKDSNFTGVYGTTSAGANLEGSIRFDNLIGAGTFKGDSIGGAFTDNLRIDNTTSGSTLNLTVEDDGAFAGKFTANDATNGNNGITVTTNNDSNLFMLVNGIDFTDIHQTGIVTRAFGTSNQELTFENSTFTHPDLAKPPSSTGGGAIDIGGTGGGASWSVDYSIVNNQVTGAQGTAIAAQFVGTAGIAHGFISGNTIGTPGVAGFQGGQTQVGVAQGGAAISVSMEQDPTAATGSILEQFVTIQNNVMADLKDGFGIRIRSANGQNATTHPIMEVTVTGNTVEQMSGNVKAPFYALAGGNDPDFGTVGLDVRNNTFDVSGAAVTPNKAYGPMYLDQIAFTNSSYYLPGYTGTQGESYGGTASRQLTNFFADASHLNNLINTSAPITGDATYLVWAQDAKLTNSTLQPAQTGSNTQLPPAAELTFAPQSTNGAIQDKPLGDPGVSTSEENGAGGATGSEGSGGIGTDQGGAPGPVPVDSSPVVDDGVVSQAEISFLVDQAIARWAAAGATPDQLAAMRGANFLVADMPGVEAGTSSGHDILLDSNGAGFGWFVDTTPGDDAEFNGSGTRLMANDGGPAAGKLDLLTVIMHELGHQAGLVDDYNANDVADLMYGYTNPGERRLPAQGEAANAAPGSVTGDVFSLTPIYTVPTLNAGKTVEVSFQSTFNNLPAGQISPDVNTSTVTYNDPAAKNVSGSETWNTTNSTLQIDSLVLGDRVFNDLNKNNFYDSGEGKDGVVLNLYVDNGSMSGVLDATDTFVTSVTTAGGGLYSFTGLAPGDYIVQVDAVNFTSGKPLENLQSVQGGGDPDDNADNDDNGVDAYNGTVASQAITLSYNNEGPDFSGAGVSGDDTNNTLDFGFLLNLPPDAVNDSVTVDEDSGATDLTSTLLGNDTDPENDTLTITSGTNGSHGTVSVVAGVLTYTPNANYNGSDSFNYTISDGHSHTDTATVSVTIGAVNDPVTNNAPTETDVYEDFQSPVAGLSISDVDATLAPAGVYEVTLTATHGTLTLTTLTGLTFTGGSDGTADTTMTFHGTLSAINTALATTKFTSDSNYVGDATLTMTATDNVGGTVATGTGSGTSDTDIVTLHVLNTNDAPSGGDYVHADSNEDTAVTLLTFEFGFTDPLDGNALAGVKISTGPANGTIYYDPDGAGGVAPTALAAGDTMTAAGLTAGSYYYLPNQDYVGSDSFTFAVQDNGGTDHGGVDTDQSPNTYSFAIAAENDAPVNHLPLPQTVNEDHTLLFTSANANPVSVTDVDVASGTISVELTVQHGVLGVGASGATVGGAGTDDVTISGSLSDVNAALSGLSYTPDANYNGSDTLHMVTDDGGATGSGGTQSDIDDLSITVAAVNDTPVVSSTPPVTTNEQTAVTVASTVTLSDIDLDAFNGGLGNYSGATLRAANNGGDNPSDLFTIVNGTNYTVSGGNLVDGSNNVFATFTGGNGTQLVITFTSTGTPATTALVQDVAQHIQYTNTSDAPPASVDVVIALNDGDFVSGNQGVEPNGSFLDSIATDVVTVNITAVNDPPVIDLNGAAIGSDTAITYTENDPATKLATAATVVDPDLLDFNTGTVTFQFSNSTGLGEDRLTIVNQGNGAGQIGVSGSNVSYGGTLIGTFTGGTNGSTPLVVTLNANANNAAVQALVRDVAYTNVTDNPSAADRTVTVTLTDGDGGTSNVPTATVHVAPVNDAPVANDDNVSAVKNHSATYAAATLTGNDTDAEGDTIAITAVHNGSNGTVVLNGDGTVTFTPTANYFGPATFTYDVSDGHGGTDTATVNVDVEPNTPPVANDDSLTAVEDTPKTYLASDLIGNDTDADGDPLHISAVSNAQHGNVVLNGNGTVTFTPAADYNGPASFDYTVSDGLDTDTATASVAVSAVNDAPTASVSAALAATEQQTTNIKNTMTVADVDAGSGSVTATVSVDYGILNAAAGTSGVGLSGSGTASVTITGTLAQINDFLSTNATSSFGYVPNTDTPPATTTLHLQVNDNGHTGAGLGQTSAIQNSTITITAVDDPPVAQPDAVATPENAVLAGNVFNNNGSGADSDVDGPPLQVSAVNGVSASVGQTITLPSGAKLTLNANGTFSYDPNGAYNHLTNTAGGETGASNTQGSDSFTYTLQGGNTTTVTVTIAGVATADDWLVGTSGNDIITGTPNGDFFMLQQGGNDIAVGLGGGDAFYFGAALTAADQVNGGGGKDILAIQGNYSAGLTLGAANLVGVESLAVLSHSDNRFGGGSANPYSYNLTTVEANVAAGQQLIVNAANLEAGENLTFNGSAETDGTFFIYGGKGIDTLTGGAGADVFFFAEDGRFGPGDHVDGGAGQDILVLRGNYSITLTGTEIVHIETVSLMSGSDARFYAPGTPFSYDITTSDATVAAGETLTFNGATLGATETFHFNGSAETDGAFRLFGGAADDVLVGGSGNDLLYGGLGADTLTGGAGADVFRYQSTAESGGAAIDHIQDFTLGDIIDLSRIDADTTQAGDQAFSFMSGATTFTGAGHAGELIAVNNGGGIWTVSGDVNGDGAADFQIVVNVADSGTHSLTSGDFFL
ncbi:MAG: hypothetical protein QOH04_2571 [Sphingomonadales bacterium]|nr:hypothetical protein [Sphingomonadales bacterium]